MGKWVIGLPWKGQQMSPEEELERVGANEIIDTFTDSPSRSRSRREILSSCGENGSEEKEECELIVSPGSRGEEYDINLKRNENSDVGAGTKGSPNHQNGVGNVDQGDGGGEGQERGQRKGKGEGEGEREGRMKGEESAKIGKKEEQQNEKQTDVERIKDKIVTEIETKANVKSPHFNVEANPMKEKGKEIKIKTETEKKIKMDTKEENDGILEVKITHPLLNNSNLDGQLPSDAKNKGEKYSFNLHSSRGIILEGKIEGDDPNASHNQLYDISREYERITGNDVERVTLVDPRAEQVVITSTGSKVWVLPSTHSFSRHSGVCVVLGDKNIKAVPHQLKVGDILRLGSVGLLITELNTGTNNNKIIKESEEKSKNKSSSCSNSNNNGNSKSKSNANEDDECQAKNHQHIFSKNTDQYTNIYSEIKQKQSMKRQYATSSTGSLSSSTKDIDTGTGRGKLTEIETDSDVDMDVEILHSQVVKRLRDPISTEWPYRVTKSKEEYLKETNNVIEQGNLPQCYICMDGEETEDDPLVSACDCKGGTAFLHLQCLKKLVEVEEDTRFGPATQRANKNVKNSKDSPQCRVCKGYYATHIRSVSDNKISALQNETIKAPSVTMTVITKHDKVPELFNSFYKVSFAGGVSEVSIGRAMTSDVVIAYRTVSTKHATIKYDAKTGSFYYLDAKSSNGSLLYIRQAIEMRRNATLNLRLGRCMVSLFVGNNNNKKNKKSSAVAKLINAASASAHSTFSRLVNTIIPRGNTSGLKSQIKYCDPRDDETVKAFNGNSDVLGLLGFQQDPITVNRNNQYHRLSRSNWNMMNQLLLHQSGHSGGGGSQYNDSNIFLGASKSNYVKSGSMINNNNDALPPPQRSKGGFNAFTNMNTKRTANQASQSVDGISSGTFHVPSNHGQEQGWGLVDNNHSSHIHVPASLHRQRGNNNRDNDSIDNNMQSVGPGGVFFSQFSALNRGPSNLTVQQSDEQDAARIAAIESSHIELKSSILRSGSGSCLIEEEEVSRGIHKNLVDKDESQQSSLDNVSDYFASEPLIFQTHGSPSLAENLSGMEFNGRRVNSLDTMLSAAGNYNSSRSKIPSLQLPTMNNNNTNDNNSNNNISGRSTTRSDTLDTSDASVISESQIEININGILPPSSSSSFSSSTTTTAGGNQNRNRNRHEEETGSSSERNLGDHRNPNERKKIVNVSRVPSSLSPEIPFEINDDDMMFPAPTGSYAYEGEKEVSRSAHESLLARNSAGCVYEQVDHSTIDQQLLEEYGYFKEATWSSQIEANTLFSRPELSRSLYPTLRSTKAKDGEEEREGKDGKGNENSYAEKQGETGGGSEEEQMDDSYAKVNIRPLKFSRTREYQR